MYWKVLHQKSLTNLIFVQIRQACNINTYCGIFAQIKNWGARETVIAGQRLDNTQKYQRHH
jgi:hypothetical protein